MAEHQLRITEVPEVQILNKDLIVAVSADEQLLGTVTMSRGGIGWRPRSDQQERHLTWEQFDRMIQKEFDGR